MAWASHVIALAIVLALAVPWVASADQVVNTLDTTIDPALETAQITSGGSTSVGFFVQPSNTVPPGDANGCNATGANPAAATLSVPAAVSASSTSLTFAGCGIAQNVTFSSSTPGSYTISVQSVTGGKTGSLWDTAPASFTLVVNAPPDVTPPVTTITLNPAIPDGNNGWYKSNVHMTVAATDNTGGSGVAETRCVLDPGTTPATFDDLPAISCAYAGSGADVTSDGQHAIYAASKDSAGNKESVQSKGFKIDKTAPSIDCGSADGLWHQTDVSITCTASDKVSLLANSADASFSLSTSVAADTETDAASTGTHEVCDNAGNCSTAGPIGGNKVDKKAPTITIIAPTASNYLLNQAVAADYTCKDGGSGVASCSGPVASGSNINTSSVGSKGFTVNATDNVGNSSSLSVNYNVAYDLKLLYDSSKAAKLGSTIPIKIQLVDANGANVSSSSVGVTAISVTKLSDNAPGTLDDSGNANPESNFRYDGTLAGYIFNLSTKGLSSGTYVLNFTVAGDPTPHSVQFQIK